MQKKKCNVWYSSEEHLSLLHSYKQGSLSMVLQCVTLGCISYMCMYEAGEGKKTEGDMISN